MLYCHTILWGAEGLGKGCVKIMLIVSCLGWLTCLFLSIMVGFEMFTIQPQLKNGTHFSCYNYESLPKADNVQMSLCFTLI